MREATKFVGLVREGEARMVLPTQKTRSTAGPLCIIHYLLPLCPGRSFSLLCLFPAYFTCCVRPRQGYPHGGRRRGAVLRSLDGEVVFEFLHPRLQILDFALLFFQEQVFNSIQP